MDSRRYIDGWSVLVMSGTLVQHAAAAK